MEVRINLFIRKYGEKCMWAAGLCAILGIFFHHILVIELLSKWLFIVGMILAGHPILFRAYQGLKFKTVGIECLVSIAVIGACIIGEFSEAAIVTFLFQFGSYLEQKTMKKTRSAIRELVDMAPSTAWKLEDGEVEEIDVDEVEEGDLLLVKTGVQIPVDGLVTEGEGYVNEASITGESVPVHKNQGMNLYAGTILDSGTLQMEATKVGEDTTFAKIIALVEEAQDAKSPAERFIDKFAKYYTPAVVLLAALVFVITRNLDTAITVLVLACPGALVIGAPIANVAGIGRGAKEGILLKGGDSVHAFVKTDTFVFDKTGTLTEGRPQVTEITYYNKEAENQANFNKEEILALAASAETTSEHPLAQAIVRYARSQKITVANTFDANVLKGRGVQAMVDGYEVLVGNARLMEEKEITLSKAMQEDLKERQLDGVTTVFTSVGGRVLALISIADQVKPDAKEAMISLKKLGIKKLVMLTGDNEKTARVVAEQIGIDEFHGELLPHEKLELLRKLQKEGHVVTFVGDGVNDSPAITAADTGIAMGSGTDVAIDSSDVVLIKSDLASMAKALELAKRTVSIMYQNIAIAVGTVFLLLIGLFAGYIHMSIGMLIHEASILVVIFNAMRLLTIKNRI
ncbi:MAG: cation-translocating P-type ATPase [Dorea sp.]|nr:cation-translocating P-type ATPase [Dorea sp.]